MFARPVIFILCTVAVFELVRCDVYRLPKNIKPIRYNLTMEPILPDGIYHGSVTIEIKTLESTSNITLHKKEFDIAYNDIKIISSSGAEIQLIETSEDETAETYTIHLETELLKNNNYNVTIGNFSRHLRYKDGFFLVRYRGESGDARSIAVTHFEPTGARLAFPCFDEPALKAKFIINLIRKEGYHSVSNEELDKTENLGDGRFKDTFKETPDMPTYAVAFVVSDYKFTEKIDRNRVYAPARFIDNGELDYSLHVGAKTLRALEDYTGINYTLSKVDQFAVPNFPVYAMENWGLVIYREGFLLKSNTTNAEELQKTNCYIAHEYAHQWFGNLVTPEWWNYLWISESFAAYFQYYIASVVEPTWRLMDQFVVDMVHKALREEEFRSAHPLNFPIHRSGQYPDFHIMYEKGSAIVRMMEHFLTHDVFKRGLQIHLQNKKFSYAVPSDLYNALQQAVDKAGVNNLLGNMTVQDILKTWDSKKGFPTVTVTRNYTTGSITVSQFSTVEPSRIIPINYAFSSDNATDFSKTTADYWLTEGNVTIDNNFPTDGWIIINKQQTGYYRVNYDLENWERLIDYMNSDNFTSIHVLNRAQLIDDAFNFAYNKMIPWHIAFRLGDYLIRETDYIPFAAFYNCLERYVRIYESYHHNGWRKTREYVYFLNYTLINSIAKGASEYYVYQEYLGTTLSGIAVYFKSLTQSNTTHLDELHRIKFERFESRHRN